MNRNLLISRIRYLHKALTPKELKIYVGLWALFILSLVGMITGFVVSFTTTIPSSGGSYVEGVVGRPHLINPLYAENNPVDRDLVRLLYSGLVRFDGETLIPDLAKDWTISEDRKTYTFNLRKDITWPDGAQFTAKDVVYTLSAIQDERYQSPRIASLQGVTITQVDDFTVKFELSKAFSPFLEVLTVGILPEHIWSNIPPESVQITDFNLQPIGLGPYKFKKFTKTKFGTIHSYTMERNENYHLGAPLIKTISMKFFDTPEEALDGLNKRDLDGLGFVSINDRNRIQQPQIQPRSLKLTQYTALFFNLSGNSPVVNKDIRKALALSVDKSGIVRETLKGHGRVIQGPILPGYPGYNESIEVFEFDVEQARAVLAESGWKRGDDGVFRDKNDKPLSLKITTADTPELVSVAEYIRRLWKDMGAEVNIQAVNTDLIQSEIISPRNFDILLFGQITGLDPDPYPFWHSSQISRDGFNISNFKNTEADKTLEEARAIADLNKKAEKYVHFQNILVAQIPAIFLYNPDYIYPVDKRVKGIDGTIMTNASDRFARVHKWYIKTKRRLR